MSLHSDAGGILGTQPLIQHLAFNIQDKNLRVADAVLYDAKGREVARGSGNFMKSALSLESVEGYE